MFIAKGKNELFAFLLNVTILVTSFIISLYAQVKFRGVKISRQFIAKIITKSEEERDQEKIE